MSHTWKHKGVSFTGNSDLSGDITIIREGESFDVPGDALEEFIAAHLVRRIASRMEDEDPLVVLGVVPKP